MDLSAESETSTDHTAGVDHFFQEPHICRDVIVAIEPSQKTCDQLSRNDAVAVSVDRSQELLKCPVSENNQSNCVTAESANSSFRNGCLPVDGFTDGAGTPDSDPFGVFLPSWTHCVEG